MSRINILSLDKSVEELMLTITFREVVRADGVVFRRVEFHLLLWFEGHFVLVLRDE